MNDETKKHIKTWSGCLLWFLAAILLFKGCDWYSSHQKEKKLDAYIEKKRNDSIRKAFIKDSLAHDLHYQDSIRREEERNRKWKEEQDAIDQKGIAGFMLLGDSVYHTSFHPIRYANNHAYSFMASERNKLFFLTANEIKSKGYVYCDVCSETEDVWNRYFDNELIDREDASSYDLIPIEDAGEYCDRPHADDYVERDDYEDDRY